MWNLSLVWWEFILRGIIVYFFVLVLLRFTGKRQVGQLAPFDLVLLLILSNAVQNAMNGGDNSITGGIILASVLVVLSVLTAYSTYKSPRMETLLEGRPTLLIHDGKILHHQLEKEFLNARELRIMLRRQGVHNVEEVAEGVLESNGQLSILKKSETI